MEESAPEFIKNKANNIHLLYELSKSYTLKPDKNTIVALANKLTIFKTSKVSLACNILETQCKFFPTLAHFHEIIKLLDENYQSVDSQVLKILEAAKVCAPRCKISYQNAKDEIGERLMQACREIGWSRIVEAKDDFQIRQISIRLKNILSENKSSNALLE